MKKAKKEEDYIIQHEKDCPCKTCVEARKLTVETGAEHVVMTFPKEDDK